MLVTVCHKINYKSHKTSIHLYKLTKFSTSWSLRFCNSLYDSQSFNHSPPGSWVWVLKNELQVTQKVTNTNSINKTNSSDKVNEIYDGLTEFLRHVDQFLLTNNLSSIHIEKRERSEPVFLQWVIKFSVRGLVRKDSHDYSNRTDVNLTEENKSLFILLFQWPYSFVFGCKRDRKRCRVTME